MENTDEPRRNPLAGAFPPPPPNTDFNKRFIQRLPHVPEWIMLFNHENDDWYSLTNPTLRSLLESYAEPEDCQSLPKSYIKNVDLLIGLKQVWKSRPHSARWTLEEFQAGTGLSGAEYRKKFDSGAYLAEMVCMRCQQECSFKDSELWTEVTDNTLQKEVRLHWKCIGCYTCGTKYTEGGIMPVGWVFPLDNGTIRCVNCYDRATKGVGRAILSAPPGEISFYPMPGVYY